MGTTYLDLTNKLLRRINDVNLTASTFSGATGVHASAKDAIVDVVREINVERPDWPFNSSEGSEVLTIGQEEYLWPANFGGVDWKSFQIQKDAVLNINHSSLEYINREEWYANERNIDYDTETDGRDLPKYVFPSYTLGYGVTPSPNHEYTLVYRYYTIPGDMSLYTDECNIPSRWDHVIVNGALLYMNLFKEDPETFDRVKTLYKDGRDNMITTYYPNPTYMYDYRLPDRKRFNQFDWRI